jgi:putative oxidoreductase
MSKKLVMRQILRLQFIERAAEKLGRVFMINFVARCLRPLFKVLSLLVPSVDLMVRLWVAKIFFVAGLTKIESWDTTMMLFQYEYHVPILPPVFAAVIGTGAELILPVLLVLGLGGRVSIAAFFIYNMMAVVSYHYLWTPEGALGLDQHINWGLLLALMMTRGFSKYSLDYWLSKRHGYLFEEQPS